MRANAFSVKDAACSPITTLCAEPQLFATACAPMHTKTPKKLPTPQACYLAGPKCAQTGGSGRPKRVCTGNSGKPKCVRARDSRGCRFTKHNVYSKRQTSNQVTRLSRAEIACNKQKPHYPQSLLHLKLNAPLWQCKSMEKPFKTNQRRKRKMAVQKAKNTAKAGTQTAHVCSPKTEKRNVEPFLELKPLVRQQHGVINPSSAGFIGVTLFLFLSLLVLKPKPCCPRACFRQRCERSLKQTDVCRQYVENDAVQDLQSDADCGFCEPRANASFLGKFHEK